MPSLHEIGDETAQAEGLAHIIPGHDPLVLKRYPAPKPELEGIVARLDVAPKTAD